MRLGKHGWRIKGSYRNFDKAEESEKGAVREPTDQLQQSL